jgi:hypothetical protein
MCSFTRFQYNRFNTIGSVLPELAQNWTTAFANTPGYSTFLFILIVMLLARSAYLKSRIHDGMRELWGLSLGWLKSEDTISPAGKYDNGPTGGIYRIRSSKLYQSTFQLVKWRINPSYVGIYILGWIAAVLIFSTIVLTQRGYIAWSEQQNRYCQLTPEPIEVKETGAMAAKPFKTDDKCWASGLKVAGGEIYLVTLRLTQPWIDRTIPTSPVGYSSSHLVTYLRPLLLIRRAIAGNWFQPMLRIVPASGRSGHTTLLNIRDRDPIYYAEFRAAFSGEVFLFVNDIMPLFFKDGWDLYDNNKGEAVVSITRIPRNP